MRENVVREMDEEEEMKCNIISFIFFLFKFIISNKYLEGGGTFWGK